MKKDKGHGYRPGRDESRPGSAPFTMLNRSRRAVEKSRNTDAITRSTRIHVRVACLNSYNSNLGQYCHWPKCDSEKQWVGLSRGG